MKGYLKRPQGPMSTLPSGVDYTLKSYFDHWRKTTGVPPLLEHKLGTARLLGNESLIAKFRSRSFGYHDKETGAYFQGMLDDALELPSGAIVPLDNKTKGFPPDAIHFTYAHQMSAYTLFLREAGIPTEPRAYLVYWYFDHKHMDLENPLRFNVSVHEVKTDPDEALNDFRLAAQMLAEPIPPRHKACAFCAYKDAEYI
jgi:hypothetical protein